ncbi:MAG TPA: methylmalonyl Co-A mutase-associated GTPase MeaB [Ornithinimicrobium sp.]|uniref:methylmalonyl Co-A mutase-associated GTPase MeaB n=1 Tax=Ornithinimicrobium sp. TaxID=1977084 RepID=UPI002B46D5E5|nr:methylmalonyl Co-A mutase-associated GTPase MeaB [Ornithinimicrobium sp.]HKJ12467.1 methylmalonyl Co-A mutase-associated GTPase MeaB [Ornithinimicrobium sp.]
MRRAREVDVRAWVASAREGSPRAVARLITLVENSHPALPEVMAVLAPHTGHAWLIGLTGSPGVGKSTTTTMLVRAFRDEGLRVGVLAVDPSSPFSGGALLGDRVRMSDHALDTGVYVRSMASRGHLGGLAAATPQALRVLDGAGCDVVIVETVGVGQSEVEVTGLADTTVVLLAPGMGDGVQAAKAGILEVGDVLVVNKADRTGADSTARELRQMISLGDRTQPGMWRPPVLKTMADRGEGREELVAALRKHRDHTRASGEWQRRRVSRAEREVEAIALARLRERMRGLPDGSSLHEVAERVAAGDLDPYAAARQVLDG